MDAQQFLSEFGHIANAPGGVARLRELVLAMAVQGRLVLQDESEEPAAKQLERIKTIALNRPAVGRRKKAPATSHIDGTATSQLPRGWVNTRLSALVRVLNGRAYSKQELLEAGTPVLRVGNLFTSDHWYYSNLELDDDKYIDAGDLLYAWSASFGPFIWQGKRVIYHYHIWKLDLFSDADVDKKFLYTWLLEKTQEIKAAGHGISMAHMTKEKFEQLVIALPPLKEQTRIVAKVDELMALCDQLEKQQADRRKLQNALRQSTLQALASAQSPHELQDSWQRLQTNFRRLFSAPEDVDGMRGLVLDLAVRGLLVEQSDSDEPVVSWLARVATLKADLAKKKLIAKQTTFVDVSLEDYPFSVPSGWAFVRLGQVANKIGSGSTPRGGREVYVKEGVPFLRSQNVWNDGLRLAGVAYITNSEHERMAGTTVLPNDVLLNITGASLGRCALVPSDFGEANVSQHVTIIRPTDPQVREYLHLCLLSPYCQALIWGRQVGMAREGLSKKVLEQFEIPFPPIPEQHRIVARVSELMRYCDEIAEQLRSTQKAAERFAASVVTALTGISIEQEEEPPMKAPQTELVAPLRLGTPPDLKAQAPLATLLARHKGEMSARDLWQRFGGEIDAFYAQLKAEVAHGWIAEPAVAEVRERLTEAAGG
ncbi:restriction endonuclease subunit S [Cupriavidus sp. D384]|uniref:restriction endonuclease subunit S n=1 Tax=Cupriavidus sp. D384 TaxID=1538095 RepID=UPI000829DD43|nr:restriction endonuclease subunit S [Cupriavidus sp. D384]